MYLIFLFHTKQKRAFKQIFLIKLKFLRFELAIQQKYSKRFIEQFNCYRELREQKIRKKTELTNFKTLE